MSTATATKEAAKGEEAPKKSKKKLFIIIAVVVLLIGGYEAKSMLMKTTYAPGQKVPLGKTLPIDQLTVSMSDGHMVQVNITMQLTVVAVPATLGGELPSFDDAAITVLGSQTYKSVLSPDGRAKAKAEILAAFQKIAGTAEGAAQQVASIAFTTFVVQ
jgi:flagellar FliL protein